MLIKEGLYKEAQAHAKEARIPQEIICEIIKEHGDKLFKQKKYEEAIMQYTHTFGHLNPSYVIQNFIKANQLDSLIIYLDKLIKHEKK